MEKSARRDQYIVTIEQQNEKIKKYEAKLRDVVAAYKGLLKEKEALEATVKSISKFSSTKSASSVPDSSSDGDSKTKPGTFVDPLNATGHAEECSGATPEQLKEQITTLTQALATVSEEKSRMEGNFQADKRRLHQEREELERKSLEEKERHEQKEKDYQEQLQGYRTRLRNVQHDREKEANDHQIMLRELQKLVATERSTREQLETQLEEAQLNIALAASQPDRSDEYQKKIQELTKKLESMKGKLKTSEEKALQPSPLLLQLQQEIAEMKSRHQLAVEQEQRRANEAEERLLHMARITEERAAGLEGRLAELSEVVGTYDRQRQQDQLAIQRLKERVSQLDVENTALARAAGCINFQRDCEKEVDESTFDADVLKERIAELKDMLNVASQKSEKPVDGEVSESILHHMTNLDGNIHAQCQQDMSKLKEEFENYKLRAQSVLKSKKKETTNDKEVELLRSQLSDARERMRQLRSEMEETEHDHAALVSSLHSAISEIKSNQKQQVMAIESDWKSKVAEIEQQVQRQRERSFTLLEEKDKEILVLKSQLGIGQRLYRKNSKGAGDKVMATGIENMTEDSMAEVVSELSKFASSDKKEVQFLHYVQQLARKDVEIANLRKAKHQLEGGMRELQMNFLGKEEKYNDEIESLSDQISRLQRNTSREGANLEYLKNVVLSYMLSSSPSSRQHMLNAIAAVLKFSAKELDSVKLYNSTWWWNPSAS